MIKGFKDFLLRGNVIDLAVAVVIGIAFTGLVTAFTNNIINPIVATAGGTNVNGLAFRIIDDNSKTLVDFGAVISALINFMIIAAVLYFLVVAPVNMIMERRKRGEEPEAEATPEDIALLQEIRDLLRARQGGV